MTTQKSKKSKGKAKKKHRSTFSKILKYFFITILLLCLFGGAALSGVVYSIIKTAPPVDTNMILSLNEPSKLFDDEENFMDKVITTKERTVVSFNEVPDNLKNAFVSIEDERFYKHIGIDIKRILGTVYIDVVNKIRGRSELQGASTITQQLLKNTLLSPEQRMKRKIQEMYMAIKLEKSLSKDQILEAYMNTIFLGGKAYGIEAASNQYFNKHVKDLNLIECAYLAGVPQSPSIYSPFNPKTKEDPSIYLDRTKTVLMKMYENKKISKEDYDNAIKDLDNKKLVFNINVSGQSDKLKNEWFTLPALHQVQEDLKAKYKYNDDEVQQLFMYGALKIYTTMNKSLQEETQKIINDPKNYSSITLKGNPEGNKDIVQPQASAVVMDYHTGTVKAIVGGRGENPALSYNRATFNGISYFNRPLGSTIKPLSIYAAAIDTNKATAATAIEDSPFSLEEVKKLGLAKKDWPWPQNWNYKYLGYVGLREAIARSLNTVSVKLGNTIGVKTAATYAEKFGLVLDNADKTSLGALALGELEHGTTPMEVSAAYGVFGNKGQYTEPVFYTKVVDRTGTVLLESKTTTKKVLSEQSAYIMYDLLKEPVYSPVGTAGAARFSNMEVRGKTGSTEEYKNVWFAGLTPYYSGAVWIGCDRPVPMNASSSVPSSIWAKIMESAHKNLASKKLSMPSGIVTAPICKLSGKLATNLCAKDPRGNQVINELFKEGTIPTDTCDVHVSAKVNKSNGKLASSSTPSELAETKVFLSRPYAPGVPLADQIYVIPTQQDDTKPAPEQNKDKDKDKDKDKEKDKDKDKPNTGGTTPSGTNTPSGNTTNAGTNTTPGENTNTTGGNTTSGNTGETNTPSTGGNAANENLNTNGTGTINENLNKPKQ